MRKPTKGERMYNPYQFQQFYQPYQPYQQQPEAAFAEVDGRESINMLQIPPNQRRVYFDRNMERFYTVETDAAGMKSVRAYDFAPADESSEQYVTVKDFDEWRESIEQLVQKIGGANANARPAPPSPREDTRG